MYIDEIIKLLPLLKYCSGKSTQETGILSELLKYLPVEARWAVEFGQRSLGEGTLGEIAARENWNLLNMDACALIDYRHSTSPNGNGIWQLAKHFITPNNINELLGKYGVPEKPSILVIDVDGMDYWCMQSILLQRRPELIVVEYNCNIPVHVAATLSLNESHTYENNKAYGASFTALSGLALKFRYRLVHVHGPLNLYFLREDIYMPQHLLPTQSVMTQENLNRIANVESFYDYFHPGQRPSWFATPDPDFRSAPWLILDEPFAE